jgi:hypothetical protein
LDLLLGIPSWARAETCTNTIFYGVEYRNPSFENIKVQKLRKNPIFHVQDPILALPGHGSKIPVVFMRDT